MHFLHSGLLILLTALHSPHYSCIYIRAVQIAFERLKGGQRGIKPDEQVLSPISNTIIPYML